MICGKVLLVQTENLFFIGRDSYLLHNHNMHPMGINCLPLDFCLVSISASIWANQCELSLREFWRNCVRTNNTKTLNYEKLLTKLGISYQCCVEIRICYRYSPVLNLSIYTHLFNRGEKNSKFEFLLYNHGPQFLLKISKSCIFNQRLVAILSCKFLTFLK
jgi:hypothetical protein